MRKIISMLMCMVLMIGGALPTTAYARELPAGQKKTAERIAKVCMDNYEKYGVLPSVCVGQAFIESTLGEHCNGNNLWGIRSGKEHYSTLEEGVFRYLEVINNGYYKGAPFQKDYHKQIRIILDGGYCHPEGSYYRDIIWSINAYHFDRYDKKLFRRLKEEKERKKQKKEEKKYIKDNKKPLEPFFSQYDKSVPDGIIYADTETISGGCVMVYDENKRFIGIFDVRQPDDEATKGNRIASGNSKIQGKVYLKVFEEAKG